MPHHGEGEERQDEGRGADELELRLMKALAHPLRAEAALRLAKTGEKPISLTMSFAVFEGIAQQLASCVS